MDDGVAISYKVLQKGVPIHASGGERVGVVNRVLDNVKENIFDGIVMDAEAGGQVFVDAPEVARVAERAVTLTIDAAEAAQLPAYEKGAPEFAADPSPGRLKRMFGSGWRKR